MTALKAIVLTLAGLVVVGVGIVFSGAIDVGADTKDSALTKWVLSNARIRSIARGARAVQPVNLEDPSLIATGAGHYSGMCVPCHLAPGVEESETRAGLNPQPPDLTKGTGPLRDAEMFWIVKHGIRMTGMPAWGLTHSDDMIWAMVAFVKKLPSLTPDQYRTMIPADAHAEHHMEEDGAASIQ